MKRLTFSRLALCVICGASMALLPSLSHAQWEPEMRLTVQDSVSNTSPNNGYCVAAAGDTVHVVWYDRRYSLNDDRICYKRSTNGGLTWGADILLTNTSDSRNPSVAASGLDVHIVWNEIIGGNTEIVTKRSTNAGATWFSTIQLTNVVSNSENPAVALAPPRVHVVWQDYRNGNWDVYYIRSTDGGASWGPNQRLTASDSQQQRPAVAASGNNVYTVWQDDRQTRSPEIWFKSSTDGGASWGADVRLTNYDSLYSRNPSLAATSSMIHVVWSDSRGAGYGIYYKRSTNGGGTWSTDARIHNSDTSWYYTPSVAINPPRVHVVWEHNPQGNNSVYTTRSTDSGLTWEPVFRLNTGLSYGSHEPSVATAGLKVHAVWWDERHGSNGEIYYRRNLVGGSGVEDDKGFEGSRVQGFKITPNPFTSFATLPGHEAERFSLYDVSGRKVGTSRGDRVGEGLAPGVYFLRSSDSNAKPLRIVKMR